MREVGAMLQNTGPYGPNETPISMGGAVNMSQMSTNPNFTPNLSNAGKIAHPAPEQPSPQYPIPEYSIYNHSSLNLSQQINNYPNFQPPTPHSSYMPSNSTSYPDASWQNGFFPMNFNAQPPHGYNMLNYSSNFEKSVPSTNFLDQHFHGKSLPINIPQVPTKAFQKYHSDDYEMFTMEKEKYQLHHRSLIEDTNDYMQEKAAERPLLDNTKRRSLENTVRLIEDILINTSRNKEIEQQKDSISDDKDSISDEKDSTLDEKHFKLREKKTVQRDSIIKSTKQSKNTYHTKETNLKETITSKANDVKPKEVMEIKEDLNDETDEEETESKENINNEEENSPQSKPEEPEEIEESNNKNKDNDPLLDKESINIKTESSSPEPLSEEPECIDVKPILNSVFVKLDVEGDPYIDVKVENISWTDTDYVNPFHRDAHGLQREDVTSGDIIDSEVSVKDAFEAIQNGKWFHFLMAS